MPTRPRPIFAFLAALLALCAATQSHAQTVIYVNAAAAPGGDGTSWGTAFDSLQPAISVASTLSGPTEIWIAQGRYIPTVEREVSNRRTRSFNFSGSGSVRLLGGFAGNESDPSARSPETRPTMLSGDLDGNDQPDFVGIDDNCFHIVSITATGNVSFDGLRFSGGYSNRVPSPDSDNNGAAIHCLSDAALSIRNCVFTGNSGQPAGWGYGIIYRSTVSAAPLVMDRCWIVGNRGSGAAAIFTYGNADITNCVIAGNVHEIGQLLSLVAPVGRTVRFTNNTVVHNTTSSSTELINADGQIDNFVFSRNILWSNGPQQTFRSSPHAQQAGHNIIQAPIPSQTATDLITDPLLVDPDGPDNVIGTLDDNYSLQQGSPAIDTGGFPGIYSTGYVDARGAIRLVDGDSNGSIVVDRGALEFGSTPFAGRIYVSANTPSPNAGLSWDQAFLDLQEALDTAASVNSLNPGAIAELWISVGTYRPSAPLSQGGSRSASFTLQNNLGVYGGFIGNETELAQRPALPANTAEALDPTRATILSGDLNGDDNGDQSRLDNSIHVVTVPSGTLASSRLDGATIAHGNANAASGLDHAGGGMICAPSSGATISQCRFLLNTAVSGGALYCQNQSATSFDRCAFSQNKTLNMSGSAGAVVLAFSGPTLFRICEFEKNQDFGGRTDLGAGVVGIDTSVAAFVNCVFRQNSSVAGSGVFVLNRSALTGPSASASFVNCQFLGNRVTGSVGHGVVRLENSPSHELQFVNCAFVGNAAPSGSALAWDSASAVIRQCTFVANQTPSNAGAVHANTNPGGVQISGCLAFANVIGTGSGVQAAVSGALGGASVSYSSLQGWTSGFGGTGNNAADPVFVRLPSPGADLQWGTLDDDYGDLRLGAGSPAVDSADSSDFPQDTYDIDANGIVTQSLPIDLLGFPRFVDDPAAANTGIGMPPLDRGAYESQINCLTCPGPREWRSPLGGSWDFPSNWTPSVPNSTHDTLFNLSANYTVTLPPAQSLSVNSAMFSKGGVSFSLGGSSISLLSISTTSFELGTLANTAAAVSLTGGTINAVDARIGSAVASTGTLNIGAGGLFSTSRSLTVGFQGIGNLNISGGGRVFSRDATVGDQATSRGTVSVSGANSKWDIPFFLIIDGGEVNVSSGGALTTGFGTYLFNQGRISGDGTINGPVVNFGAIVPGNSPGTLTINGNYEQVGQIVGLGNAAGRVEAQVGGTAPGTYDRLVVNGTATLGGGLYVSLMNGFVPSAGDAFPLVNASSGLVKPFDVIFFPALPAPTTGAQKFLRANYSGLRGPGGLVSVGVADLGINPDFGSPQPTSLTGGPSSAAIGDLNGDGLPDLAIAIPDPSQPSTQSGQLVVLFNRGGTGASWLGFQAGTQQLSVGADPRSIAIADLDGVNGNDLIVANAGSNTLSILTQTASPGTFGGQQTQPVGVEPVSVAVGDFDRDDSVDVVVANRGGTADTGSLSLLENITTTPGTVAFVPRLVPLPTQRKPTHVNPFNPDNDKDLDLAVTMTDLTGTAGELAVVINGLDHTVAPPLLQAQGVTARTAVGPAPIQSAAARFLPNAPPGTQPFRQDVITVSPSSNSVTVLVNTTLERDSVNFAAPVDYVIPSGGAAGSAPLSVALVDMDDDALKDPDIAVLSRTATGTNREIKILRNDSTAAQGSNPAQIAFAQVSQGLAAGGISSPPFTLLVGNVDGDGRPDLVTVNSPGLRGNTSSVQVLRNTLPPLSQAIGACCIGASCLLKPLSECVGAGQHFIGLSTACNLPTDFRTPCCKADMNQSGSVSIDDLFLFLNGWFTSQTSADTDSSGVITIDDLFLFLNAWFLGC